MSEELNSAPIEDLNQETTIQPAGGDVDQQVHLLMPEDHFAPDGVTPRIQNPAKAEFMARAGNSDEKSASAYRTRLKDAWGKNLYARQESMREKIATHSTNADELETKAGRAYDKFHGNEERARDYLENGTRAKQIGRKVVRFAQSAGEAFKKKDAPVEEPVQMTPTWNSPYTIPLYGSFASHDSVVSPPKRTKPGKQ